MKLPKITKKLCPYCRKHQEVTVGLAKQKGRSKTHPLSRGGKIRTRLRGERRGYGNLGRYSKVKKFKMTGAKTTKKIVRLYKCNTCKKSFSSKGFRAKKAEIK